MATFMTTKPFLGCSQGLAAQQQARVSARAPLRVQAAASTADRPLWLPGVEAPKHLRGDAPGDRGFDPLGLGTNENRFKWLAEGEKTNGRWAMAAVAGILGQEILAPQNGTWFEAGTREYAIPPLPLTGLEFLLLGLLETKRYVGFKKTGQSGFFDSFPFDPLGMNSEQMAEKEIKNGRLAMVAFVGFAVQALVTRQSPLQNLFAHLGDPFNKNIIGSVADLPNTLANANASSLL